MLYQIIPAQVEGVNTMGNILMVPTAKTVTNADTRNAALTFGVLGVCLAGLLGIAGGLARRSASGIVLAALLGLVLGLTCGVGFSFAVLPFFFRTEPFYPEYDLILSMIMHGSIWGSIGAAGGLTFAAGLGVRRVYGRALLAGLMGAVLGTIGFELIGVVLFPLENTGQPVSTSWPTRLMARLTVTLMTAAFIILLLPEPQHDIPSPKPVSR